MTFPSFVLGLDLGTSGCKASLLDERGACAGEAREGYAVRSPQPRWAEQDPADWLAAAVAAVRRLMAETRVAADRVAGLALTSAAHIGVLLDGRGEPVRPAILWNDQRTVAEVADLEREAGAEILRATCQAASTGWTLAHLRWVRRHDPAAWDRTRRLLLSKDYLLLWLTGCAATDPATAVSSQLWDVGAGCWSPRLCALAGVSPDLLPPARPATEVAGGLTAGSASALGLRAGLPVVIGTLDSATELVAAGLLEPGASLVRLATAGGVERVVAGPVPDRRRITYPHAAAPAWYCQAGTSTCAAAVQWGKSLFRDGGREVSFDAWNAEAARVPAGSEGVLFHPYLAGERAPHWDPRLRASFTGLALGHGRGHLARAIYEGTAFSIRQALAVLPEAPAADAATWAVVGGGARSSLWVDILAQVLGRPLRVAEGADSSHGAALLGLAGLGLVADWRALAAARAQAGRRVQPDPGKRDVYDRGFDAYVRAHARLAPIYGE